MAQELPMHRLASIDERLLSCIACGQIAVQPLLLRCLHSCCSRCADQVCTADGSKSTICPACKVSTDISMPKHHNGFIANLGRLTTAAKDAGYCCLCKEDGKPDEQADDWCMQCQRSVCSTCLAGHSRCNPDHVIVAIDHINCMSEVLQASVQQQCLQHQKPLDLLCFDCKKAKCTDCLTQCLGPGHSVPQPLIEPKAKAFLKDARVSVQNVLQDVNEKSAQLLWARSLVSDIRLARAIHLDELRTKKKYAVDALSKSFKEAKSKVKDCYDQLEASAVALQSLAEQLNLSVQHASAYISSITDLASDPDFLDQRATLRSWLEVLDKQMDSFSETPDVEKFVALNGSLPDDLDDVVTSWMGTPELTSDCLDRILAEASSCKNDAGNSNVAVEQPVLNFGRASNSFRMPVDCCDLSVTSEGHLLLAAWEHGMKEYSESGRELGAWKPAKLSNGLEDCVTAVRSLEVGRAAVVLYDSRLVLLLRRSSASERLRSRLVRLLRRSGSAAASGEDDLQWLEDRRVAVLPWSPWNLSVLGDLLAVAQGRGGRGLQLLQLSTGQLLHSQKCEYSIASVALTAAALVTTSRGLVKLDVVDSCSHRGDRQWRHELSSEERARGVCAAGSLLYVAVLERQLQDRSKNYVKVLSAETGEMLQQVLSYSSHGLQWPRWLSLGGGHRTVLAVLGYDEASSQSMNVTVYPAAAAAAAENRR